MTLAGLSAKLIAAGVAGWTAGKAEGWGTDEAKAFQAGLDAVPAFAAFLKAKDRQAAPLQLYCELVTAAFGEAWRRHWAYDERLAPRGSSSGLRAWFLPAKKRERLAQLERRLRMGRFEAVLLGDGGAAGELELLGKLGEPLRSPWYRALWEAFATLDELDEGPPLLFLADSGAHAAAKPKLEFEEHFGIAFREGLASEKGQPLREWLGTLDQEKAPRVRELLAARISSFRREHVFGRQAGGSEVAYLPLEDLYVEPRAKVVKERRGQVEEPDARPVLTFVEQLLQLPSTRGLIVQADFGRGKSMTARTLAYRCAESYLRDAVTPSSAVPFPIFARCSDTLRSRDLTLEGTAQRAQSALLRGVDKSALPRVDLAGQAYLFLLDGLDEVQLSESEAQELFDALLDANGSKFVVFGRPGAIPSSVAEREGIVRIELQDFDSSQVEQWLERWMALHGEGDRPKLEELEAKNLLELCATPVLLFMVAQTWSVIRHKADCTSGTSRFESIWWLGSGPPCFERSLKRKTQRRGGDSKIGSAERGFSRVTTIRSTYC